MVQNGNKAHAPFLQAGKLAGLKEETNGALHRRTSGALAPAPEDRIMAVADLPDVPWERMKGERTNAYAGFIHFRDLGFTRTLAYFVETAPEEIRTIVKGNGDGYRKVIPTKRFKTTANNWSAKYRWYERAEAWDDHIMAEWSNNRARSLMQALDTNAAGATNFLQKLFKRVENMDPEKIPLSVLHQYFRTFSDIQMLSLGHKTTKLGEEEDAAGGGQTVVNLNILGQEEGTIEKIVTPPLADDELPAQRP